MVSINGSQGFDIESLINNVTADLSKGSIEDKKVTEARIKSHTEKIHDKRQERIDNLKEQMKGPPGGGGCFKFLQAVFKVFDFLMKPISALTLGKFRVELSKTLDMLKDAKYQKRLLALQANGQDILKVIQGLKKLLQDDFDSMKIQDDQGAKESQRIMQILDEIQDTFKATSQV